MSTRQIVISVVAGLLTLCIIGILVFGVMNSKKDLKRPAPPKNIRKVDSEIVNYSSVKASVKATGRVVSQQSVDIIAEVQGKLLPGDIALKKGKDFKQGDILVKIYNQDAAYAMKARKSAYLNAIANILPDLKIDFKEDYQNWVTFFGQIKIDAALPDLPEVPSNQLKIFLASRNILSEYYAIKSDEIRLSKYTIRAPYDGAIQNVLLEVGSVANPGSRIAQIIKTSQLEVEIPVESASASWLRIGDRAILKTESDGLAGEGRIKRISSFVDPGTQSINVYLEVIRQSEKLFPGEYLRVEFGGMTIDNAMEIPRNAVFNRNMVFTVDSGMLRKKTINLLKINEQTIVFNGLMEGSEIVTEPLANANDRMQVQTDFTQPPAVDSLQSDAAAWPKK